MAVISTPPSGHPFARGHSALIHVTDPEGWVRGKASLDTGSRDLTMVLGLETDSTTTGVKGRMRVRVLDRHHREIALVEMRHDIGIPGKTPGGARIEEFTFVKRMPQEVVDRASALDIEVEYTGKQFGLWGIPFQVVLDAIVILVEVA